MRVVVCGSGFGVEYLKALRLDGKHELGPLVARGSDRSREVANLFGIGLVESIGAVEGAVDVACLALPMRAIRPVAEECFARGIDVLLEHPIVEDELTPIIAAASAAGRSAHVSVLWPRVPHVGAFVDACHALGSREAALRVRAACSYRLAYALCDLLLDAFPGHELVLRSSTTSELGGQTGSALVQTSWGELGSTRIAIEVSYLSNVEDDGTDLLEAFEVAAVFPSGKLVLVGPRGPVVWSPHAFPFATRASPPPGADPERASIIGPPPASAMELQFSVYGVMAQEIDAFDRQSRGTPPHQEAERIRRVSRAWTSLVPHRGPRPRDVVVRDVLWGRT